MPRPYFTAKHLESMELLPETLEIGRAYFIDDEQVIVIDHGRGPVIYGKAPGPQGQAGEPIPQLQGQIDALTAAAFTTQKTIWDINKREISDAQQTDEDIAFLRTHFAQEIADTSRELTNLIGKETVDRLSDIASLDVKLSNSIQEQGDRIDSALNILARSIAELYPEHFAPEDSQDDPLDNETLSTESGSYTIQQTILKDGTIVLNLTPQQQVIDTLKTGDSVDFDGSTWIVDDIQTVDGTTSITIRP